MIYRGQRPARVRSDCDVMSLPGASGDVTNVLCWLQATITRKNAPVVPVGSSPLKSDWNPHVGSSHTCWTLELTPKCGTIYMYIYMFILYTYIRPWWYIPECCVPKSGGPVRFTNLEPVSSWYSEIALLADSASRAVTWDIFVYYRI